MTQRLTVSTLEINPISSEEKKKKDFEMSRIQDILLTECRNLTMVCAIDSSIETNFNLQKT
jgi:hypothetical protein